MNFIVFACIFLLASPAFADAEHNGFGGWTGVQTEATGWFHAREIDGVWWIVDPVGNGFISKGVNHITYHGDHSPQLGYSPYEQHVNELYDTRGEWADAVVERLKRWGFNTVGSWSDEIMRRQRMPYTMILNIGSRAGADWQRGVFPDVYSKRFRQMANHIALTQCKKRSDDVMLIGYYPDNELRWGPDWRSDNSLLIDFLLMEADEEGGEAARRFIQARYPSVELFNRAWGLSLASWENLNSIQSAPPGEAREQDERDFLRQTAEQYFRVCYEAIKKADPNHMLLGCRFAGYAPEEVLAAAGTYSDLISYNSYNVLPPEDALKRVYETARKPVMLTEFSFKAMDSGLPNSKGAGKPVKTQADRAERFTAYVEALMKMPFCVGYHWFKYADQPAEGRFDGENSNYGLVTLKDRPWEELTAEMTETNRQVEAIHLESSL